MSINPMNHYSLENPGTIYDEESLTALELCGRLAKKLNEVVSGHNSLEEANRKVYEELKREAQELKNSVATAVQNHISSGAFDRQIDRYMSTIDNDLAVLEARVSALTQLPAGSTVGDAELTDARISSTGDTYATAGDAIRGQYVYLKESMDNIAGATVVPVYGSAVTPKALYVGASFTEKDCKLIAGTDLTKTYGVAVFEVQKGIRYKVNAHALSGYLVPVIADTLITSGNLVNPVKLASGVRDFVAPKTGYFYMCVSQVGTMHTYYALTPVNDCVPVIPSETGEKVTVSHSVMEEYGLVVGADMVARVPNESTNVFSVVLTPGTYSFDSPGWVVGTSVFNPRFVPLVKTVKAGDQLTASTDYYFVSMDAPRVSRVLPVDAAKIGEVEAPSATLNRAGKVNVTKGVVVEKKSDFFGLFNLATRDKIAPGGGGRYQLFRYFVSKGQQYLLECANYSFPSGDYPLFGFGLVENPGNDIFVVCGEPNTTSGAHSHVFTAPFDGYLYVSHDAQAPSTIIIYEVEKATLTVETSTGASGNTTVIQQNTGRKYKKLMTVGDSLSGNTGLWQPTCIEKLGCPSYTTAGNAGLSIAYKGETTNSIYNHVMALGASGVAVASEPVTLEPTITLEGYQFQTISDPNGILQGSSSPEYVNVLCYAVSADVEYSYQGTNMWAPVENNPVIAFCTGTPEAGVSMDEVLVSSPAGNAKGQNYSGTFTPTEDGYLCCADYNYPTNGRISISVASSSGDGDTGTEDTTPDVEPGEVDLITFWGGYNDWNTGTTLSTLAEQLDPATRDNTTFAGGALDCIEHLLTLYPKAQFVMVGTTPFSYPDRATDWRKLKNSSSNYISEFVDVFRSIAEHYSIPFLDLLHNSGFNEFNYPIYYLEQSSESIGIYYLHPNATGNKRLGEQIAGYIKSLG